MKVSINFKNKLMKTYEMVNDSIFQVLEFGELKGAIDSNTAIGIKTMNENNIRLKQVRIILENTAIKIQPGTLNYMRGDIEKEEDQSGF